MRIVLDLVAATDLSELREEAEKLESLTPQAAAVASLTGPQRQCLHLTLEYKSSKEIALLLGMTTHSVDWHMKAAMRKLGVDSRIAAAIVLRDHDRLPETRQLLARQTPELGEPSPAIDLVARNHSWSDHDEGDGEDEIRDGGSVAHDWLAAATPPDYAARAGRISDVIGLPWGSRNSLRPLQRLILILLIAGFSALSFGAVVASLGALQQLL